MTYAAIEASISDGAPIYLYEFKQSALVSWRFTSDLVDVDYLGVTWASKAITHSDVALRSDVVSTSVKLEFPITDAFASQFLGYPPDALISMTIYRKHRDAIDYRVIFKGRVSVPVANDASISMECESLQSRIKQNGLQSKMTRMCRHTVYVGMCRLNRGDWAVPVSIASMAGRVVTINASSSVTPGELTGGMIKSATGELRMIESHVGLVITLVRPFAQLLSEVESEGAGYVAQAYPGCQRNRAACAEFNNRDNFGGFPWIPVKNPFAGGSVI